MSALTSTGTPPAARSRPFAAISKSGSKRWSSELAPRHDLTERPPACGRTAELGQRQRVVRERERDDALYLRLPLAGFQVDARGLLCPGDIERSVHDADDSAGVDDRERRTAQTFGGRHVKLEGTRTAESTVVVDE